MHRYELVHGLNVKPGGTHVKILKVLQLIPDCKRFFLNDHSYGKGIKKDSGTYTSDVSETLNLMMQVHFPGSLPVLNEETTS